MQSCWRWRTPTSGARGDSSRRHVRRSNSAIPAEKAADFRSLHERDGAFIIPNPWDVGPHDCWRDLASKALATTSAGYAFSVGQRDNTIGRERMIAHVAQMSSATDTGERRPENGFGDEPATVAETIRLAAGAGAAGGSIEDATGEADGAHHDIDFAWSARTCRRCSALSRHSIHLTARAENFLVGRPDLRGTIKTPPGVSGCWS
jgi:2-methylisocitrate lyase-like PEP mutase family enzyme